MIGRYHILKRMAVVVVLILYLCFNCFLFSSCSSWAWSKVFGNWNPQGDWGYDLNEDYSIWRINSGTICLVKVNKDLHTGTDVVESYITSFAYNDRFIAARRLDVPDGYKQEDILQMDFDQAEYFIVDADTDMVYGPYSSGEDFQTKCDELKVGDLGSWIDTYPAPEGVKY